MAKQNTTNQEKYITRTFTDSSIVQVFSIEFVDGQPMSSLKFEGEFSGKTQADASWAVRQAGVKISANDVFNIIPGQSYTYRMPVETFKSLAELVLDDED